MSLFTFSGKIRLQTRLASSLAFGWVLALAACDKPSTSPQPLAIASESEAKDFVEGFISAAESEDFEEALRRLCEQDALSQTNARRQLEESGVQSNPSPYKNYEVRSALAHWVGREPYFWVDVGFGSPQELRFFRSYRVRVRDGCIEHFMGPPAKGATAPQPKAPIEDEPVEADELPTLIDDKPTEENPAVP